MSEPSHSGVVKSYNNAKGFGFILCDGVEGDIMFGRNDVPGPLQGTGMNGAEVAFDMVLGTSGKGMRACNLRFANQDQMVAEASVSGGVMDDSGALDNLLLQFGGADGTAMHIGQIKSCNRQKGFGFIVAPTVEGDIWFSTRETVLPPGLDDSKLRGLPCSFDAFETPDVPPKVRASSVQIFAGVNGGAPPAVAAPPSKLGDQRGTVKAFNGSYGFICAASPAGTLDGIYFKAQDIVGLAPEDVVQGMSVVCDVYFHKDGKPQGKCVRCDTSASGVKRSAPPAWAQPAAKRAAAVAEGIQLLGHIKRFRPADAAGGGKAGFGFIRCDEAGDEDIWFNHKSLPVELQSRTELEIVGQTVGFTVRFKPDGKMAGDDLCLV